MRNKRLDILRCIALFLVFGRHGIVEGVWKETGWAGVDLFFVLSGFLISGLLFSEYKKKQRIDLRRFYIRRGFKIYPAFYVMLLLTFLVAEGYGVHIPLGPWLREIFFIQNYKHAIWRHTWTLAVEEHFYIFLPLLLIVLTKVSRNKSNPFRSIPYVYCILALLTLIARTVTVYQPSFQFEDTPKVMFATHLRMDALFFGVLLGYFHHFRPELIPNLLKSRRNRLVVEASTALLLSPILGFYAESRFLLSAGLTLIYLGFGGVLVVSLYSSRPAVSWWSRLTGKVGDVLAYVGVYSYSIYLWHVAVAVYGLRVVNMITPVPLGQVSLTVLYVGFSIGFGILMARVVEFPALALRDRLFPGTTVATSAGQAKKRQAVTLNLAGIATE